MYVLVLVWVIWHLVFGRAVRHPEHSWALTYDHFSILLSEEAIAYQTEKSNYIRRSYLILVIHFR